MAVAARNVARMSTHIYDALRERLVSGAYAQGDRLSVEALRGEFEVSKQPIMEALRLLSADGLVEIIPQVGCVTMAYPMREISDFFAMFAGFEGAIAAAAAERRTADQLEQLERISRRIGAIGDDLDHAERADQYRVLNREFHAMIHAMSDSRIMTETSRRMWDMSDYLINTAGAARPFGGVTHERHDEHEAIRAAIIAGDAPAAHDAMSHHIRETVHLISS